DRELAGRYVNGLPLSLICDGIVPPARRRGPGAVARVGVVTIQIPPDHGVDDQVRTAQMSNFPFVLCRELTIAKLDRIRLRVLPHVILEHLATGADALKYGESRRLPASSAAVESRHEYTDE